MASTSAAYYERAHFIEPRRALTLEAARRRTRVIRALRIGLAAGMVGILAGIASEVARHSNDVMAGEASRPVGEREVVRMTNPRFTGRDTAGSPYVIIADAAVRRADDPNRSELESPALTFEDPDNPATFVSARRGVFHREEGALELEGEVHFESGSGYRFSSERARVYLRDSRVVGDAPVEGEGPLGAIQAQSFEIVQGGERVLFHGEVVATINQEPRLAPPLDDPAYDATLEPGPPLVAEEPSAGAAELRREEAGSGTDALAAAVDADEEAQDEDS